MRVGACEEGRGDAELAGLLVAGDSGALEEAYDRYAPVVYGLARRVTRDAQAAEDVTQEVFGRLWERPLAFDPARGSLRVWLSTLAHRRAVDWVRAEQRRRRMNALPDLATPEPGVDVDVIAADVAGRVRRAVTALPPDLRAAIVLAYYGGHTYRQVARVLGLPEGTAKSRIRLGLRRIATALEGEGIGR